MMRLAWLLVVFYAVAMAFGLFGILVAIPHPELWAGNAVAMRVYAFALTRTGGTGMILGALAMFAYGLAALGARRTILFFLAATIVSLSAELTGTKTGWPFGGYAYTDFLGVKILGRVPFPIPLSWFAMGFAAFLVADALVVARGIRERIPAAIVLGAWLLTAWDLVLDPSMASPQLAYVHFWVWHEHGPYFGMPLRNLAGWFATGLVFITLGRVLWGERDAPLVPPLLPFVVYAIGVVWSMVIALRAGMWQTALIGTLLALAPAAYALRPARAAAAAR
jgi:putative membrane protein